MSDVRGDVATITLTSVFTQIVPVVSTGVFVASTLDDCCTELPLLADTSDTDPLKNDVTRNLHQGYDAATTGVDLFLTKPSDSAFVEVALDDNTYGTFFSFGFHTDDLARNYIDYEVQWRIVLAAFGEGTYQIRRDATVIVGPIQSTFDFAYCLGNFSDERADGTIRLAMKNSFSLGNIRNVRDRVQYPKNWTSQIRVPGYFGYDNSDYDKEYTKFNDGALVAIKDQQVQHYKMRIERQPVAVHQFVKTVFWQAEEKDVTDYNRDNYASGDFRHINTPVRNNNEYKPVVREDTKLATVDVECDDRFDNFLVKFCN